MIVIIIIVDDIVIVSIAVGDIVIVIIVVDILIVNISISSSLWIHRLSFSNKDREGREGRERDTGQGREI